MVFEIGKKNAIFVIKKIKKLVKMYKTPLAHTMKHYLRYLRFLVFLYHIIAGFVSQKATTRFVCKRVPSSSR